MTTRPYLSKIYCWNWKDEQGNVTPGILLRKGKHVAAHLTATEAIQLANRLVDLAEQLEAHHDQVPA